MKPRDGLSDSGPLNSREGSDNQEDRLQAHEQMLDADLMRFLLAWLGDNVPELTEPAKPLPCEIEQYVRNADKSQLMVLLVKVLVQLRTPDDLRQD